MIGDRKIVALCISRLHDSDNNRFISKLAEALRKDNCSLFIYNMTTDLFWKDDDLRAEVAVFDLIDYDVTDAVVIMDEKVKSHAIAKKIVARSKERDIPVVVVDGKYDGCVSVHFDYAAGFEKIVRHVVEYHGARKLRLMAGFKGNPFSDEREEVFKKVLAENGIEFDPSMVDYAEFWARPAIAAAERIVDSGDIPEAVVCCNDIMALNVANVFMRRGVNVPERTIVTGFDGIEEIFYSHPKITSVKTSSTALAETVYSAVGGLLNGRKLPDALYIEPSLIVNDSCGCVLPEEADANQINRFNSRFYHYQDDNIALNEICDIMQTNWELASAARVLRCDIVDNMSVILNKECVDSSHDYFGTVRNEPFSPAAYMFFDSDDKKLRQYDMRRKDIVPDLDKKLASGYPLIFNCLYYMNVPIGYICYCFEHYDLTEYSKLMSVTNAVSRGVGGMINLRYQRYLLERVENLYMYDALTSLCTRTSFIKRYDKLLSEAVENSRITVVLSDLDGLKKINDNFGHLSGDVAIREVANALKLACPSDAVCVRYGGDEMIAIIVGECDPEGVRRRVNGRLDNFNKTSGAAYTVSTSIGIVSEDLTPDTDLEALIRRADKLMYEEKRLKK